MKRCIIIIIIIIEWTLRTYKFRDIW
jgi:hypothetical protein